MVADYEKIAESVVIEDEVLVRDRAETDLAPTNYSHEALIEVLIEEPSLTQLELAKKFGRKPQWIAIVINSDSFQAALSLRQKQINNPFVAATIDERFRGLVTQSLEILSESLELKRSPDLALEALNIATKALGLNTRIPLPTVAVQSNFIIQLPDKINDANTWAIAHKS